MFLLKVKIMQRLGTKQSETKSSHKNPKWEKTVKIQREHGQPNEQLFPKRLPLSNRN